MHVKVDNRGTLKSTFDYPIHTGSDEGGFIHRQIVIPGNIHSNVERDILLQGDEAALYAEAAYSS